ncbi:hypothetical protein BH09PAT2_BH09PAT2_10770 [soil metagenome]
MEELIKDYLKQLKPKLCILSTVDIIGKPQSAVMAYAVQDDLKIILSTHDNTRKYMNIEKNPNVSLVFGWNFKDYNVQYEGVAELITDNSEIEEIYFFANPKLIQFKDQIGMAYIRVTPTWIRLTDFSVHPAKVQEKNFDS